MKVHVAQIGMCFGIERAYKMINQLVTQTPSLHAVHKSRSANKSPEWDTFDRIERGDPVLLDRYPNLEQLKIAHDDSQLRSGDELAIGYHGYTRQRIADLRGRGVKLHDFTCPFISRMHDTAEKLSRDGFDIIAFGKPHNPHTTYCKRTAEQNGRVGLIAEDVAEIADCLNAPARNWACIGQVTGNAARWAAFSAALKTLDIPIHFVDTVCRDSYDRQHEAKKIAAASDIVILVDDGGGAALSVLEAARTANNRIYRTGTDMPLKAEWFEGVTTVAVVGGIMVPDWVLSSVAVEIAKISATTALDKNQDKQ